MISTREQARRDKIRAYRTGRSHSEETKRKISQTLRERYFDPDLEAESLLYRAKRSAR
jgi:NUMOD3 motif